MVKNIFSTLSIGFVAWVTLQRLEENIITPYFRAFKEELYLEFWIVYGGSFLFLCLGFLLLLMAVWRKEGKRLYVVSSLGGFIFPLVFNFLSIVTTIDRNDPENSVWFVLGVTSLLSLATIILLLYYVGKQVQQILAKKDGA